MKILINHFLRIFLTTSFTDFSYCFAVGIGRLYIHEALQRGRIRDEATKDRRLHDCHSFQRGPRGLPYVCGAFGARPR